MTRVRLTRISLSRAAKSAPHFNAFAAALIYFIQTIASLEQLHAIVFYLMGSVPMLGYRGVGFLAVASVLATVALVSMARDYNALTIGEEGAAQLGVDVERTKRRSFVLGSLLTGLAVSVAGLIGGSTNALYSVTKHGVVALTENLYVDLQTEGTQIGCSVLCPGFVNTNIFDSGRNRPSDLANEEAPPAPTITALDLNT